MWRRRLMLLLAGTVTLLALISAELGQGNTATIEMLWILGGFILVFGVAHAILRFLAPWSDQVLLPVVAALNGLGLVMIHRLDMANGTSLVRSQVMWTVLGVAMFVAVMVLLRDHRSLSRYSYILGLVGLLLLAQDIPVLKRPTSSAMIRLERRWVEWRRRRAARSQ